MFFKLTNSIRIYIALAIMLFLIVGNGYAQKLEQEAINKGLDYTNKGKLNEAIVEFSKAIEINSNNAFVYYHRGLAYHKKGELDKAISDYDEAIEISPKDAEVYYNRGIAYYYKDYVDEAISDWSKAIEISPNSVAIYQKRAFAYFQKQEYDKSWDDVQRIEALGYQVQATFLEDLKRFSHRDK